MVGRDTQGAGEDGLKMVIDFSGDGAMVGVRREGSDPQFTRVAGNTEDVFRALPGVVKEAVRQWESVGASRRIRVQRKPKPRLRRRV